MRHRTLLLFFVTVIGIAAAYHIAVGQGNAKQQTPQGVAEALDRLIQPRFQVEAGVFGMARIGIQGHDPIVYNNDNRYHHETPSFDGRLAAVTRHTSLAATVGFLHCVRKPGKFKPSDSPEEVPDVRKLLYAKPTYDMFYLIKDRLYDNGSDGAPDPAANAWNEHNSDAVEAACVQALPRLRQGIGQNARVGDMLVVMRPVRALHNSCVSCHSGTKRGDTLGVMVYTVSR